MKKLLIVCISLMMAGTVMAQTIVGSAHDFQSAGWNSTGRICITCHTPHNADTTVTGSPLWNHEVTAATFTLYSSATLQASDMGQPDGVSKLCLSCHDGTVALDAFGGASGTTPMGAVNANLGTSLADDHPVSFTYDTALATADGELFDPATASSGITGGTTIAADMLYGGKMECSSCHDVHNTPGFGNLLVKSNAGSALCLTCHNK